METERRTHTRHTTKKLNDSNDIEILLEKWFSSEYLPEIHNLINDFDLTSVTEEWLIRIVPLYRNVSLSHPRDCRTDDTGGTDETFHTVFIGFIQTYSKH